MLTVPSYCTMTSPLTPKEVPTHLFVNILELHSRDIANINKKGGMWNYKKLHATSIDFLEKLYKSYRISLDALQYISEWKMYVDNYQPSYDNIMATTSDTRETVDFKTLLLNHSLSRTAIVSPKPTVTPSTVTTGQMEAVSFLKYCSVKLMDKSQILSFYDTDNWV